MKEEKIGDVAKRWFCLSYFKDICPQLELCRFTTGNMLLHPRSSPPKKKCSLHEAYSITVEICAFLIDRSFVQFLILVQLVSKQRLPHSNNVKRRKLLDGKLIFAYITSHFTTCR